MMWLDMDHDAPLLLYGHVWTKKLAEKLSLIHCSQFICQGKGKVHYGAGELVLLNTCGSWHCVYGTMFVFNWLPNHSTKNSISIYNLSSLRQNPLSFLIPVTLST